MKKLLLISGGLILCLAVEAQTKDTLSQSKNDSSKFVAVEVLPEFPGGFEGFYNYLNKNLKYPKESKNNGTEGTVRISFVVERDGSVTDIKVVNSVAPDIDAEAVRLMTKSPKWKPAMHGGHPVRAQFSVPLQFKL